MLISLVGLVTVLHRGSLHYRIFVSAGSALWTSQPAYGTDFGTSLGYWFYSPSCGMFFFGPFSRLPETLGLGLFVAISWVAFVYGTSRFWKVVRPDDDLDPLINWFWFAIAGQVHLAITTSKLELIMTGLLLWAGACLAERRRRWFAAIILAMIANWKFQPLPAIGLVTISLLLVDRDWKWPLLFTAALFSWFLLPFLFRPASYLLAAHETWRSTLSQFIDRDWLLFDHPFKFLKNVLGVSVTYSTARLVGLSFSALLILIQVRSTWSVLMARRDRSKGIGIFTSAKSGATQISARPINERAIVVLLGLAYGALFTCLFSPLNQNNAYVLYVPLLMAGFISFGVATSTEKLLWKYVLVIAWAVMTLSYSDIMPPAQRAFLREIAVKPLGCLILGTALALYQCWHPRHTDPSDGHKLPK